MGNLDLAIQFFLQVAAITGVFSARRGSGFPLFYRFLVGSRRRGQGKAPGPDPAGSSI